MKRVLQFCVAALFLSAIVLAQSLPPSGGSSSSSSSGYYPDGGSFTALSYVSTVTTPGPGLTLANGSGIDFNGGSADVILRRSTTSTLELKGNLVSSTNGGTNLGAANKGFDYGFIFGFKDGNSVVRESFPGDDQSNYVGQSNDTTALTAHAFGSKAMTAGTDRDLIRVCNGATSCTTSTAKARITTDGTFISSSSQLKVPVVHGSGTALQAIESGAGAMTGGSLAVTFGTAFASGTPVCTCSHVNSTPIACGLNAAASTSAVTFKVAAGGTDTVNWICIGIK